MELSHVDKPKPNSKQVLVKIKAISVNPADWHTIRATPSFIRIVTGLFRPKNKVPGSDFSGIIEEVGPEVTDFKVGDEVFGEAAFGSFAEYNVVEEYRLGIKPKNSTFEEAACLGIAGLTAYQGLFTHGLLQEGQRIFINGSSGGVGHYAVQMAAACGAIVTAVCSRKNADFVLNLGAKEVLPYDKVDLDGVKGKFDVVMDNHGNLKFNHYRNLLKPNGTGVMIGFTKMSHMFKVMMRKTIGKTNIKSFTASPNSHDLHNISLLYKENDIKTSIEKTYEFKDLPNALAYIENMRTRGKVAISLGS